MVCFAVAAVLRVLPVVVASVWLLLDRSVTSERLPPPLIQAGGRALPSDRRVRDLQLVESTAVSIKPALSLCLLASLLVTCYLIASQR